MRAIILVLIILSFYYGIWILIGLKWSFILFSIVAIIFPTTCIIKKDLYYKYMEFIDPKNFHIYLNKDENFKRKIRITHLTIFYILAALMIFLSVVIPNFTLHVHRNILKYTFIPTFLFSILAYFLSPLILKKSKKNSTFWLYFSGVMCAFLLVLAFLQRFIM